MTTQIVAAPVSDVASAAARSRGERRDSGPAWALLAPFTVLYLVFLVGPAVYGLVMSFFDTSLVRPGLSGFAGLENYAAVLTSADFWASMWHTVWFTILTTPPLVVFALMLAILPDRLRRGRWFFRLVFFAPFIIPVSVVEEERGGLRRHARRFLAGAPSGCRDDLGWLVLRLLIDQLLVRVEGG